MQLLEKRISISRLRSIVFGEPKSQIKKTSSNNKKPLDKTSGRLIYSDYKQVNIVNIEHSKYQVGYLCPMKCGGKVSVANFK